MEVFFLFSITLLEFSRASSVVPRKERDVSCQATETKCTDEISSPSTYTETKNNSIKLEAKPFFDNL